jgi:hypothetical protein
MIMIPLVDKSLAILALVLLLETVALPRDIADLFLPTVGLDASPDTEIADLILEAVLPIHLPPRLRHPLWPLPMEDVVGILD